MHHDTLSFVAECDDQTCLFSVSNALIISSLFQISSKSGLSYCKRYVSCTVFLSIYISVIILNASTVELGYNVMKGTE
jgi:hypothetical protein